MLYQLLDENNATINEFQQREMALCHLDVIKELSPERTYHISVTKFDRSDRSVAPAKLLVNFG
jgi:hypothetical protein